MPSRRSHSKSRLGCLSCKARHVKCDMNLPSCRNCLRLNRPCSFSGSSVDTRVTADATLVATLSADAGTFDNLDLFLNHHYTAETSSSLSTSPSAQHFWRRTVPVAARTYFALTHGILCLAGLDLAHSNQGPGREAIFLRALHHKQLAIEMFRHTIRPDPSSADPPSLQARFYGSLIMGVLAYAQNSIEDAPLAIDDIISFFLLFRGTRTVWELEASLSTSEDVLRLFSERTERPTEYERIVASDTISDLEHLAQDINMEPALVQAIHLLVRAYEAMIARELEMRVLGFWPSQLSDRMCDLLRRRDEKALQVLNHYAEMLRVYRHLWWVGDLHRKYRDCISRCLSPGDMLAASS